MTEATAVTAPAETGVHSSRGPSGASRWMNCVGSNNLIDKLVAKFGPQVVQAGEEAARGTFGHNILARCLADGHDAWEHAGEKGEVEGWKFTCDEEMVDGIQMTIDFVKAKLANLRELGKNPILLVEVRVASPDHPAAYGTSDIIILVPGDRLIVIDFKYGAGVAIEPDDEQLRLYGQYAIQTYGLRKSWDNSQACDSTTENDFTFPDPNTVVELYIAQPRIPHPKGFIRRHVTNKAELARWWHGEALEALKATYDPVAALTIGEHCKFCPANKMNACPALAGAAKAIQDDIEPITMTDEEIGALLAKEKAILAVFKNARIEGFKRAMMGRAIPGQKVVHGIGDRVWKPGGKEEVEAQLGAEAVYSKPEFMSPAAVEKLGKDAKSLVARWAMKPETGLCLVANSDKRKAVSDPMTEYSKQTGAVEADSEAWELP